MKPCSEVIALLADVLEGELPPSVHAELERHLARCPTCVAQARGYRSTVALLRSIREQDLPADLRLTLRAFLDERGRN